MSKQSADILALPVEDFCREQRLSADFAGTARQHYLPFVERLVATKPAQPSLLAVSGSQGSGKSTLADFVVWATRHRGWNSVALSIDDFYLTRAEREQLAKEVHPLLQTRGVPGTHDLDLLHRSLDGLRQLQAGQQLHIPRFDKLADERCPESRWTLVPGPVDLIVFEGWCLGAQPQSEADLQFPVNELEAQEDRDGVWRTWVNRQLAEGYQKIWDRFDLFAFLRVPDFEQVLIWRQQQEQRLVAAAGSDRNAMSRPQLQRFIQHYQRITEHSLATLPALADAQFWLNPQHGIERTEFRHAWFRD